MRLTLQKGFLEIKISFTILPGNINYPITSCLTSLRFCWHGTTGLEFCHLPLWPWPTLQPSCLNFDTLLCLTLSLPNFLPLLWRKQYCKPPSWQTTDLAQFYAFTMFFMPIGISKMVSPPRPPVCHLSGTEKFIKTRTVKTVLKGLDVFIRRIIFHIFICFAN